MSGLSVIKCTVGVWKENAYLVSNNKETILIDPGDEFETIDAVFIDNTLPPISWVVATHGHFDHIGATQGFKIKYNIPFGIHSKDRRILHQANLYRKFAGDNTIFITPKIDFNLENNVGLTLGESNVVIHHTPGHSEGSVSLEIGKNLFSGDILLFNEIGRTDLPGGDKEKIIDSIRFILNNFIGYTIYPGHGMPFILDEPKKSFFERLL